MCALLTMATLAACAAGQADRPPPVTEQPVSRTLLEVETAIPAPSLASTSGAEGPTIGVTDVVTIRITDTEAG